MAIRTAGSAADQPPHPADEPMMLAMYQTTDGPRPARGKLVRKSSEDTTGSRPGAQRPKAGEAPAAA